ncbi:MAG: RNA degradosome polyphosphate kinase, partial [Vallitaleaceae bacterium]|nr:RNA degradosome polyphosphate kinase [Vallitaleaceae bacterium]
CSLIPGIPGISDQVTVRSIVGKYLEHSRIYYFYNDGKESVYLSSADWMPRNLNRRVELMFPIEDEANKKKVLHILDVVLKDTVKARIKNSNKEYQRIDRRGKEVIDSQDYFEQEANRLNQKLMEVDEADLFRTRD